jgi:hypothetical protein
MAKFEGRCQWSGMSSKCGNWGLLSSQKTLGWNWGSPFFAEVKKASAAVILSSLKFWDLFELWQFDVHFRSPRTTPSYRNCLWAMEHPGQLSNSQSCRDMLATWDDNGWQSSFRDSQKLLDSATNFTADKLDFSRSLTWPNRPRRHDRRIKAIDWLGNNTPNRLGSSSFWRCEWLSTLWIRSCWFQDSMVLTNETLSTSTSRNRVHRSVRLVWVAHLSNSEEKWLSKDLQIHPNMEIVPPPRREKTYITKWISQFQVYSIRM